MRSREHLEEKKRISNEQVQKKRVSLLLLRKEQAIA